MSHAFFDLMKLPPEIRVKVNDILPSGAKLLEVNEVAAHVVGKARRIEVIYSKNGKNYRAEISKNLGSIARDKSNYTYG